MVVSTTARARCWRLRGAERVCITESMSCEIFYIRYKDSFRWKWRHVETDGHVKESKESYELFYECVCAARRNGYAPQIKCA